MKNLLHFVVASTILVFLINVGSSNDKATDDTKTQLELLELKRAQMVQNYGDRHPSVMQINKQIQILKTNRAAKLDVEKEIQEMSDEDLRRLLARLVKRIDKLEQEVDQLKNRKPKVELPSD